MSDNRRLMWCEHCRMTVRRNSDLTCERCGDKLFDDGDTCCGCVMIFTFIAVAVVLLKWIF